MYYVVNKRGGRRGYVALAKKMPFIDGRFAFEPGETWFECGETKEEALNNLKGELPGNDWVKWEKTQ